jgi:hypothetical protein
METKVPASTPLKSVHHCSLHYGALRFKPLSTRIVLNLCTNSISKPTSYIKGRSIYYLQWSKNENFEMCQKFHCNFREQKLLQAYHDMDIFFCFLFFLCGTHVCLWKWCSLFKYTPKFPWFVKKRMLFAGSFFLWQGSTTSSRSSIFLDWILRC